MPGVLSFSPARQRCSGLLVILVFCIGCLLSSASSASAALQFGLQFGSTGSGLGQFNGPDGMAVDKATGDVYVADTLNQRIEKFDSAGDYLSEITSYGSSSSDTFTTPEGLAVDQSNGDLYVADTNANQVIELNSSGGFVSSIAVNAPAAVAVDPSGDLYVGTGDATVLEYNSSGSQIGSLTPPSGYFQSVVAVAVDPITSDVYVADSESGVVDKFSSGGAFMSYVDAGELIFPSGLAVDPLSGELFVTDTGTDYVAAFDSSGTYLGELGSSGSGNGQFEEPLAAAVDPLTGQLFVTDGTLNRVTKFSGQSGDVRQYFSPFGSVGSGNGQFEEPSGVAVDPSSATVYVTDSVNGNLQAFSSSGAFQWKVTSASSANLKDPQGVAVNPTSHTVYVADDGNNRVLTCNPSGPTCTTLISGGTLEDPGGVAVDPATGDLYVISVGNEEIQKYSSSGSFIGDISPSGESFGSLGAVAVGPGGDLYVADNRAGGANNQRIYKFDSSGNQLGSAFGSAVSALDGRGEEIDGVAVNPATGDVFVGTVYSEQVYVFDAAGDYLSEAGEPGSVFPAALAFDSSSGVLYLGSADNQNTPSIQQVGIHYVNDESATPPAVVGMTEVGQTLRAAVGDWYTPDTLNYSYQWYRCSSNQSPACQPVSNQTGETWTSPVFLDI